MNKNSTERVLFHKETTSTSIIDEDTLRAKHARDPLNEAKNCTPVSEIERVVLTESKQLGDVVVTESIATELWINLEVLPAAPRPASRSRSPLRSRRCGRSPLPPSPPRR